MKIGGKGIENLFANVVLLKNLWENTNMKRDFGMGSSNSSLELSKWHLQLMKLKIVLS
jgi:hypothetical protein